MEKVVLGRTGLQVSKAGLGCGGHSRLGQSYGNSIEQSVAVVQAAVDAGVNLIDTAAVYGTEEIVGKAVRRIRDKVVISSKHGIVRPGTSPLGHEFLSADEFIAGAESSLRRLGTDYIDIFHLHGVMPSQLEYCRSELVPALLRLREEGKIRFLGLTERFIHDTGHAMLAEALRDDTWDVVMTGFNLVNQSARQRVLSRTRDTGTGTLIMFAVRHALTNRENARDVVREAVLNGQVDARLLDPEDPLGFLVRPGIAENVIEAAYRYCRHEPGADVVLTGTGSVEHLHQNLRWLDGPPLPETVRARLEELFARVDSVSGN